MTDAVVVAEQVCTRIDGRVINRDIDLSVRRGEILALIGGSGAGKTTLLRTLIGLRRPNAGRVRIFGRDLYRADAATQRVIRQRWGVLFQGGALFSALSVFENVALPLRETRLLDDASITDVVMLKLAQVGLDPKDAPKLPAQLSGGMVKRAALARSLVLDPELLFLDEPTSGLDPLSAAAFQSLLTSLRQDLRLTVVMVTHDLDTLTVLSDRVAALAEQRLVAIGPLSEIREIDHPFLREYFSSERGRQPSP
ncbi:MAG: ATP-binding cassette domain-containing protein [Vicinamibacteria bacterium]|nr:ATP-binding cassette domain-containing protein [Vicinamibacteria bacterium]